MAHVNICRPDGVLEYLMRGPTKEFVLAQAKRIEQSFSHREVVVGRPASVGGEVQVSVVVL